MKTSNSLNIDSYRPGLIHRLRAFLLLKKEKYERLNLVLKKQADDIRLSDSYSLILHQELVEFLILEIQALEKVCQPLENDLSSVWSDPGEEMLTLWDSLYSLHEAAISQEEDNQLHLGHTVLELKKQSKSRTVQNPGFTGNTGTASRYIDISI